MVCRIKVALDQGHVDCPKGFAESSYGSTRTAWQVKKPTGKVYYRQRSEQPMSVGMPATIAVVAHPMSRCTLSREVKRAIIPCRSPCRITPWEGRHVSPITGSKQPRELPRKQCSAAFKLISASSVMLWPRMRFRGGDDTTITPCVGAATQ